MHSKQPLNHQSVWANDSKCSVVALLCSLAATSGALAQSAIAPPSGYSGMTASTPSSAGSLPSSSTLPNPSFGTSQFAGTPSEASDLAAFIPTHLLQWGPVHLHPYLRYRFSYIEGLQPQPGNTSPTYINEISPSLLITIKDHWTLDWVPTLRFYSSKNYKDTTDQSVSLRGNAERQDWQFGLMQSYSATSEPLIETGAQTDQETYATALTAHYLMSTKMSLDLSINQNLRFVDQPPGVTTYQNSLEWSTINWLNYQFWNKFTVALGAGGGYVETGKTTSDMTYEQLQARIHWTVVQKLRLTVNGGADYRQFLGSGANAPNSLSPIYGVDITYALFPVTTFDLLASRSVSASYFQDQITENTILQARVSQKLLKRLTLDISGGYRITTYQSTLQGVPTNREDDSPFFEARLSTSFLKRGTIALFYYWSDNTSTDATFGQTTKQAGVELMYRF